MLWDRSQSFFIGAGVIAAPIAFVLLTLYCQYYDMGAGPPVPLGVSMGWAAMTSASWLLIGLALWFSRQRLFAAIASGRPERSAGVFLSILAMAITIMGAVHGGGLWLQGLASDWQTLLQPVMRLAPSAALVAALVTSLLYIRHRQQEPAAKPLPSATSRPLLVPAVSVPEWLPLPEEPRLLIRIADIRLIRSAGNYCEIHADDRVHLVRAPLKTLGERVDPERFVQVHRTAIVNLATIKELAAARGTRRVELRLDQGQIVPVGPSYVGAVERRLRTEISSRPRHFRPNQRPSAPGDANVILAQARWSILNADRGERDGTRDRRGRRYAAPLGPSR